MCVTWKVRQDIVISGEGQHGGETSSLRTFVVIYETTSALIATASCSLPFDLAHCGIIR